MNDNNAISNNDEEAQGWERSSSASAPLSFTSFATSRQQQQQQQQQQLHGDDDGHPQQQQQQQQQQESEQQQNNLPKWTSFGTKHRRIVRSTPRRSRNSHNSGNHEDEDETEDSNASDHIPRGLVATPLNQESCTPMSPGARFIRNIRHEDSNVGGGGGDNYDYGGGGGGGGGTQMYRLMATRGTRDVGRFWVSVGCMQ